MYFLNNHFNSTTDSFHPPVKMIALKLYLQAWSAVASEPVKFAVTVLGPFCNIKLAICFMCMLSNARKYHKFPVTQYQSV